MARVPHMEISIERLTEFCTVAWGEKWVAPFAELLSEHLGRAVAPSQVHQWISGARPVPARVADLLPALISIRVEELRRQTVAASKIGHVISDELFAQVLGHRPKPTPDIDDGGLAPRIG